MVEAMRACSQRLDVAVLIEQTERIAVLQHLDVLIGQRGGGHNLILTNSTFDIIHDSLSSISDGPAQPGAGGGGEKKGRTNTCHASGFTKPFCDPAEHADPADGGRHRTHTIEAEDASHHLSRRQLLHDTPRNRGEGSHPSSNHDHEETDKVAVFRPDE